MVSLGSRTNSDEEQHMDHGSDGQNKLGFVYSRLRELTTLGHFKPGEQLHVGRLSTLLRVSATPIREALLRLYGEHLIGAESKRGFYLPLISVDEACELYACACMVVVWALRDEALVENSRRMQPAVLGRLKELRHARHSLAADRTGLPEAVFSYIVSLARNQVAIRIFEHVMARTHVLRMLELEQLDDQNAEIEYLEHLMNLLAEGRTANMIDMIQTALKMKQARLPDLVKEMHWRALGQQKVTEDYWPSQ
jgi:DNA-binding GntR family transcriptional regulator